MKPTEMFHATSKIKPAKSFLLKRIKIFAGAFVISLFFSLVLVGHIFHEGLPVMVLLTWLQLEIFIWLGLQFFRNLNVTASQFKKKTIMRLALFYVTVLLIASVIFIAVFFIQNSINGVSFAEAFSAFKQQEMSGIISATLIGFAFGTLFFF